MTIPEKNTDTDLTTEQLIEEITDKVKQNGKIIEEMISETSALKKV